MLFMSKRRHEKILKEIEEKHKQDLQHKEEHHNHKLRRKDNIILELEEKNDKLNYGYKSEIYHLEIKIKEIEKEKEKIEKEKEVLKSKVGVSVIVKQQLKELCVYKGDKKNLMYSFDLTPVNLNVSGRKVYDLAQILG
ncbi:Uncharacterised protein [[Clostridium] sordellii]|uniref:hypothetical protein n=1 Tax=Paraclostridium sordellii TaxID=1505 RepID=UPI0005DA6AAD|nr:hypothetical protein [Paeniclostridium sordellii]CEP39614.1 Uncharacterised protein [[Clostridium] sordellii] [Paeniclostridium sordellii]